MSSPKTLARDLAYAIFIGAVEGKHKPEELSDSLYNKHPELEPRDKAFIKELVFGSLRWYGKLYWILQHTSKRDLKSVSSEVRAALILGAYQVYYMDKVPDRAAVNESVEYIRRSGQASACSFVNGILRQIARKSAYFQKPDKEKKPAEYLEIQYAFPRWIVERWLKAFYFNQVETMLAACNKPPPYTVRVNSIKYHHENIPNLQHELLKTEKTSSDRRPLRSALQLMSSPQTAAGSLFADGHFTVQDEASQLIGFLVNPQPDELICDACAGPGGKLSHIYELGEGKIQLIGLEKKEAAYIKMQETMQRLGHLKYEAIKADFLEWKPTNPLNKILLDAPCSGLGVLRRHPEGKLHKTEHTIKEHAILQRTMIKKAIENLAPGGELIYSVCSHEPEESLDHLNFIKSTYSDNIEVISPVSRISSFYKKYVTRDNILLIFSGNPENMDGFASFIIKLK